MRKEFMGSFNLNDLKELKIGERQDAPGCATEWDTEGNARYLKYTHPNNSEFEWSSGGRCYICPGARGEECEKQGAYSPGWRPGAKRVAFKAPIKSCCLGTNVVNGIYNNQTTCNPEWTPTSDACDQTMQDFCSLGDNIFTSSKCRQWALKNNETKDKAWDIKAVRCGSEGQIKSNAYCRNFIINEGRGVFANSPDNMDAEMAVYCGKNPSDPICNCVNSNIPCPQHYDSNCRGKAAYVPKVLTLKECPDYINCQQYVDLSPAEQSSIVGVNIEQNCQMLNEDGTVSDVVMAPNSSQNTETTISDSSSITMWVIIAIIFLIFIIIISTIIFLMLRKSKQTGKSAD